MNKKIVAYVVVGGIVALIIGAFFQAPSEVTVSHLDAGSKEARPLQEQARRPQGSTHATPLPEVGAPLQLIEADLARRASEGDGGAACRLALEYQRCALTEQRVENVDRMMAGSEPGEVPHRAALPLDPNGFYVDVSHCAGVVTPPATEIAALWRSAAANGNSAAMTNYAVGNAFSVNNILDSIDELKTYKESAEAMAHQAAMAGDGGALLSLAGAYSPENQVGLRSFLAQAVRMDLTKALALYKTAYLGLNDDGAQEQMAVFIDERIAALSKRASAAQVSEADAAARQLAGEIGSLRYPSSRSIAYLRLGRTVEPKVTDCGG